MTGKNRMKKMIEAVIFSSESPVSAAALKNSLPELASEDVGAVCNELADEWGAMDRAFELVKVAGGYQFRTRKNYADEVMRFNKKIKKLRLSKAALEVLAISAYQQPLTKADVEEIRGVDSSAVMNLLTDRGLLQICGRKKVPGRPFLYKTTEEFLQTFSLEKLSDLPTLKEIEEIERDLASEPVSFKSFQTQETTEPEPPANPPGAGQTGDSQTGDGTENP